jgi:hypothetical protein
LNIPQRTANFYYTLSSIGDERSTTGMARTGSVAKIYLMEYKGDHLKINSQELMYD